MKTIGFFKDELGGKIIIEIIAIRPKTWAYLKDDDSEHKKAKGTKKCVIKRRLMFENYKDCLFNNKTIQKLQQKFESDYHEVYTEEVNKTALSSGDDKRLQAFDRFTTFSNKTNAFKVCENEMLNASKAKETLKILSKECENEMYVTGNIFLKYMETKCASEMKKHVKFEVKKKLRCFAGCK